MKKSIVPLLLKPYSCLSRIAFTLLFLHSIPEISHSQHYLGLGFHLTPPIYIERAHTSNVIVRPQPGFGASFTYKKVWSEQRRNQWYLETGLTLQGLRYHQTNYTSDSLEVWTGFPNSHTGFPSILLSGGRAFGIGKSEGKWVLGAEVSYNIAQDLLGIGSNGFEITHNNLRDGSTPLHLRLNIGYQYPFVLFKRLPLQLEWYLSASAQKITNGRQIIWKGTPDGYFGGKYSVNNSEMGIKLFAALRRNYPKLKPVSGAERRPLVFQESRARQCRISVGTQVFSPSPTVYHIPRYEGFTVSSRQRALSRQFNLDIEFPLHRHPAWSVVSGVGFGPRTSSLIFTADAGFPTDSLPIEFETSVDYGHYGILMLGFSRRFYTRTLRFSHTLCVSAMAPLGKEHAYLGVPLHSENGSPAPYIHPVLEGSIDRELGRETVVAGLEYRPELIFPLKGPFFIGLGLLAHYSRGVVAQGRFTVKNQEETYYGVVLQHFTKLGLSFRVGWGR